MTSAQIREWAITLENLIHSSRSDFHHIESAARALIASVRAEAIEEAVKEVEWIVPRGQTGLNARLVHAIRELKTKEKVQ